MINKVSALSYSDAMTYLKAFYDKNTGLTSPLPMSASVIKPSTTNLANITFKRRVSRIDVSNSAANFVLQTAQVWNARTRGYMFDEGGTFIPGTGGNEFVNNEEQIANASAGVIQAQLYAMPNLVTIPTIRDHVTTCLILGGKYNGSLTTTYYRVNVSAPAAQQLIKANGAYTINITNVTGEGEIDPGDAYDNSLLKIDYTINEWDDSFLGTYIFDEHGNGLAVSQREVTFSDAGNQDVEIEVFTIASATNPIAGVWAIGSTTGADANHFSSTTVSPTKFKVQTIAENATTDDRTAIQNITWGTITLPVKLKQLNPTSQLEGIKVTPNDIWFPIAPGPTGAKEFCVNLQGNYTGITRADILTTILYDRGVTNWLTIGDGTTPDNPALGLYYFKVTASELIAGDPSRDAFIKLAVIQGVKISTAQVSIRQTQVDTGGDPVREMSMYIFEKSGAGYINKGLIEDRYRTFKGLPAGQTGPRHLHFAIIEHMQFKYAMHIISSMGWKIKAVGNALDGLTFSKLSDPGNNSNEVIVEITAKGDVASGWDGSFYLEYDNGDREDYTVHQRGVLATLIAHTISSHPFIIPDGNIYYYGTFRMNNRLWLDREIGATSNGFYSSAETVQPVDRAARGLYLNKDQSLISCPAGFMPPDVNALTFLKNNAVFSGPSGNVAQGGIPHISTFYITTSSSPFLRYIINFNGSSQDSTGAIGFYWGERVGAQYFYTIGYHRYDVGLIEVSQKIPDSQVGYMLRCCANTP